MGRASWRIWLVAACAAVACGWFVLSGSTDEQKIRERFVELLDAANRISRVPVLEQIAIVRDVGSALAPQIGGWIRNGTSERQFSVSRREVEERALGALRGGWSDIEVSISGLAISVGKGAAEAEMEVHILGGIKGVEGKFYEHWGAKLALTKIEGEWVITQADGTNLRESK